MGRAEERFTEDALRMLRAVRFSAQLGFVLEEGTRSAIESLCGNLKKVSAERIQAELVKLLTYSSSGAASGGVGNRYHPGGAAGV